MKILVIDDNVDISNLIRIYLKKANMQDADYADSAQAGFRLLGLEDAKKDEMFEPIYDLIVIDYILPDIDGIEACRKIKQSFFYGHIPIIIMTSDHDIQTLERAFAAGAMDFLRKPLAEIELVARINSALHIKREMDLLRTKEEELRKKSHQLKIANEVLQNLYTTDPLTNINNRGHFDLYYHNEWKRCKREKAPISLIMMDVDYFKAYNDTYGHQAGDNCLIQVADALSECIHRPADFVARYGGEEFVAVLANTEHSGGLFVAEKMRQKIMALKIDHIASRYVTCSFGVATFIPNDSNTAEGLVSLADLALYQAKKRGRNLVVSATSLNLEPEPNEII